MQRLSNKLLNSFLKLKWIEEEQNQRSERNSDRQHLRPRHDEQLKRCAERSQVGWWGKTKHWGWQLKRADREQSRMGFQMSFSRLSALSKSTGCLIRIYFENYQKLKEERVHFDNYLTRDLQNRHATFEWVYQWCFGGSALESKKLKREAVEGFQRSKSQKAETAGVFSEKTGQTVGKKGCWFAGVGFSQTFARGVVDWREKHRKVKRFIVMN